MKSKFSDLTYNMQATYISQAVTKEVIVTIKMSVLSHFLVTILLYYISLQLNEYAILLYFVTIKWIFHSILEAIYILELVEKDIKFK